jgi:hypothetical protein
MKTDKRKLAGEPGIKRAKKTPVPASDLQDQFRHFIEYHPAARLNRNLRKMLLEFLMSDVAVEAFYLKDLLYDMEGLFELLDAVQSENEMKAQK